MLLMLLMMPSSIANDQTISIFMNYKKNRHDFVVNITDTVQSLKEKIKERIGILPEHQLLKRGIHSMADDNKTISSCGIKSLSKLSLSLKEKFEIQVAYNGTDYMPLRWRPRTKSHH
ncbi:hypothetical protein niasHT_025174 [Heterodera trifolii]|uniref:Ubiquitin-like domain-containing protein n=1 Tax=Heterodera trifolii TaxID=157864 RepID=A0ABD2JLA3_9BILA